MFNSMDSEWGRFMCNVKIAVAMVFIFALFTVIGSITLGALLYIISRNHGG